jgi:GAF domain-containing protein
MRSKGARELSDARGGRVARFHTHEEATRLAEIWVGTYVNVPLLRGDQFITAIAARASATRFWSLGEITLPREIAERTWAVLEGAQGRDRATRRARHLPARSASRDHWGSPLIDKAVGHAALLDEFARQLTPAG